LSLTGPLAGSSGAQREGLKSPSTRSTNLAVLTARPSNLRSSMTSSTPPRQSRSSRSKSTQPSPTSWSTGCRVVSRSPCSRCWPAPVAEYEADRTRNTRFRALDMSTGIAGRGNGHCRIARI